MAVASRVTIFTCLISMWTSLLFTTIARAASLPDANSAVTSYQKMLKELRADESLSHEISVSTIGRSSHSKRKIVMVRVGRGDSDSVATRRLLVIFRQHGDEPATTEAALLLLRGFAHGGDPELRAALPHVSLYLIPMANPDGAEAGTRNNGNNVDLNRDWGIFTQEETRSIAHVVRKLRPQIVVDAHNWDSSDAYNANCVEVSRESDSGVIIDTHNIQSDLIRRLGYDGYQVYPTSFGTDADPHLAHRYFAKLGALSMLVETHSGTVQDWSDFQRRQGLYVAVIHRLMVKLSDPVFSQKLNEHESGWIKVRTALRSAAFRARLIVSARPRPLLAHNWATARDVACFVFAWLILLFLGRRTTMPGSNPVIDKALQRHRRTESQVRIRVPDLAGARAITRSTRPTRRRVLNSDKRREETPELNSNKRLTLMTHSALIRSTLPKRVGVQLRAKDTITL